METKHTREKIEQALEKSLPAWKLPRQYVIAIRLPRTTRGKLDVPAIRALLKADR